MKEDAMDLSTTYLGLKLPHPFMPGASPLVDDVDNVRRLEDAGAAAIVMHSLFEEQITREDWFHFRATEMYRESFAEALSHFPKTESFALGPDEYLDHIRRVKAAVSLPVIGSLNGTSPGGWLKYAQLIEQAGADALELNLYNVAAGVDDAAQTVEDRAVEMVCLVKEAVRIPVAVKLSPFYTALGHFAHRLDDAGADGLILFNRFYQPDLDPENLEVMRTLALSTSSELPLRLRWLGVLSGRVRASLAVTGGVHTHLDALKALMAGADAVQVVSVLLRRGPSYLKILIAELTAWIESHEYESLAQLKGSLSLHSCPDPRAYERANYMLVLQSWNARDKVAK
jgi:dihydroorotate dehydrogenase (fumarate)